MDEKEFWKEIRAIEERARDRLGFPLPDISRRYVASRQETDGNLRYVEGSPGDNQSTVRQYDADMGAYVESVLSHPAIRPKQSEAKAAPTKIYRKTFERRFHLLAFVLDRKGFEHRAKKGFWKEMTAEWNREHPYDQRTPEDLRARYAGYIKDDALWNSYVATRITPAFDRGIKSLIEGMKAASMKALMQPILEFWKQHPEAKTLNDLIRIQEAQNDR